MSRRTQRVKIENILAVNAESEKTSFFDDVSVKSDALALEQNLDIDFARINQVKPRLKTNYPVPVNEISADKKFKAASEYLIKNPFIHLKNFPKARKIFLEVFQEFETMENDIQLLREELDKAT